MCDYKNSKVYAIRSFKTKNIYIGSTVQPLSRRMTGHRNDYKCYKKNIKNYITSFEILKHGDAYIELIELCNCSCNAELRKIEGKWIRKKDCVNKNIPGRNKKQYYVDNKDSIKEYRDDHKQQSKQYRDDHKQQSKKYRDDHKQQSKEYRDDHKQQSKEYRDDHKQQSKEYRDDHKKQKKKTSKIKITCDCGSVMRKDGKYKHIKSIKHNKYLLHKALLF
jgi:hypothetical protein